MATPLPARQCSGKATLLRYVAETILAAGEGHEAMFVAMDPGNRSLTGFLDGVLQPAKNDAAANAKWLEQLIEHAMDNQASALIDLGGGDTSLSKLLAQVPDVTQHLNRVCFNLGARWAALHGISIAGIKRDENANILGARAESERPGGGAGRARLDRGGR